MGNDKTKKNEAAVAAYIHFGCGLWSPDIQKNEANNEWYNVISCIKRTKFIKCCYCGEYGASVHCHNIHCLSSYHPELLIQHSNGTLIDRMKVIYSFASIIDWIGSLCMFSRIK